MLVVVVILVVNVVLVTVIELVAKHWLNLSALANQYNHLKTYKLFNLSFQYKPIDQFPDNAAQEHNYSNGINDMHYFKIKVGWSVRIFLPEKIHEQI